MHAKLFFQATSPSVKLPFTHASMISYKSLASRGRSTWQQAIKYDERKVDATRMYLSLRVSESAVVLQDVGPFLREHESRVEHAFVRAPLRGHTRHRALYTGRCEQARHVSKQPSSEYVRDADDAGRDVPG